MSGRKETYVTMTSSEADRLRNSARRSQESEQQARQRQQYIQDALNASNRERDSLNRTLDNEITGLHDDMRQIANEQNRRFREQAEQYNRRLQEQRSETDQKLRNQEDNFTKKLESQRKMLQSSINEVSRQAEKNRQELQNQINDIHTRIEVKEHNAQKLAEYWISNTQAYINDIAQYRHDMFTPGQLDKLRGKLNQMLSDMKNGMYEAAIATARSLFNDAVDLKEVVLNAETEWLYYQGLFVQALADTKANFSSCKEMQFTFEMEHGTETVDAKVNYWTDGALDEVSESVSAISQQTENIQQVSTQQLIDHIETLNQQNVKMDAAVSDAKEVLILSQKRAEMANKLADIMEEHMCTCERVTYEGDEQDQPVHVKFSDGMGNEIVAIISPEIGAKNMDNKLELHFFDKTNDEKQRQAWIASIHNGLKQEGLQVGETKCVEGYENKPSDSVALKDIEATAKRKIERKVKTRKEAS